VSRFLIDADPVSGQSSHFEYDPASDMYLLRQSQDVSGIAEANRREFNSDAPARRHDGLGRKVASIPLTIWMDLYRKGITRDRKAFRRWLNDSDNRVFRTAPGTV
jgi:hypothetical protein